MADGDLPESDREYTKIVWASHYGPISDAGYSMRQAIERTGHLSQLEGDDLAGVEIAAMISGYPVTAWGVSMAEGGQPKPIAPTSIGQRPRADLDSDRLFPENSRPCDGWMHVRIVPALNAPDTGRLIHDTEMRLAFEYLVGSDLIVMADRMAIGGHAASRPAYGCDLFKSVRLGSADAALGREIHDAFLTQATQDLPIEKLQAHRPLFHRMADRTIRLLDKLRRGEIIAWGKPDKTADRARIDTDVWQLPDLRCDFSRGHLIDDTGDDGWKFIRLSPPWWSPQDRERLEPQMKDKHATEVRNLSPSERKMEDIRRAYQEMYGSNECTDAIKERDYKINEALRATGKLPADGTAIPPATIYRALAGHVLPRQKPRHKSKKS